MRNAPSSLCLLKTHTDLFKHSHRKADEVELVHGQDAPLGTPSLEQLRAIDTMQIILDAISSCETDEQVRHDLSLDDNFQSHPKVFNLVGVLWCKIPARPIMFKSCAFYFN